MSDINQAAYLAKGAALGGIAGSPTAPYINTGHVNFQRSDGVGQVAISSALSSEAARRLDEFLRVLISEDAPILAQMREQAMAEAEKQQRDAYSRALANANRIPGVTEGYPQ